MTRIENDAQNALFGVGIALTKLVLLFAAMLATVQGVRLLHNAYAGTALTQQIGYVLLITFVSVMCVFMALIAGSDITRKWDGARKRGIGERAFTAIICAMLIAIAYPILKHAHGAYQQYGFDIAQMAASHFSAIAPGKNWNGEDLLLGISTAIYGFSGIATAYFMALIGMMFVYARILNALFKLLFPRYE